MPYQVQELDNVFCVFKEGETEPLVCYDSEEAAQAYFTAVTIATLDEESDDIAVKAFIPPQEVADNARLALEVRQGKPESEKGMTAVGLARANQLANRRPVSLDTIRRMIAYFTRHEVDKTGETWEEQGKGWQAWYGWGGDEGWQWAKDILEQEEAMEAKASRRHSEADMKLIRSMRKQMKSMLEILIELGDDGYDEDEQEMMEEGLAMPTEEVKSCKDDCDCKPKPKPTDEQVQQYAKSLLRRKS